MERFKKRTIALVLASVVTVVGAFGADNYRNSLMGISFEKNSADSIKMYVQTKLPYEGNVTPIRKDANTYILMLPEMNSLAQTPDLEKTLGNITSVNVRTMPYSNSARGYTRITIKTFSPTIKLSAQSQVFIPDNSGTNYTLTSSNKNSTLNYKQKTEDKNTTVKRPIKKTVPQKTSTSRRIVKKTENNQINEIDKTTSPTIVKTDSYELSNTGNNISGKLRKKQYTTSSNDNAIYLYLVALLIVLISAYLYTKAKNKMQEIAGESVDIDLSDEKTFKNKKLKKIKSTINALDTRYTNLSNKPKVNEYTTISSPVKKAKPAEELEIVDLDALFKEQKSAVSEVSEIENEENDALEEFLSGFSFNEFEIEENIEESASFDEEFYQKTIQNNNLSFSKNDLDCLNQLLSTEINDETLRNIEQYAVSNPIKKQPTKKQILENIATDYAISQNIIFTSDDMEILHKLISVELDQDFITDLRTNSKRTSEMAQEIQSFGDKSKKPSEIITMSVKDLLPDLSEALKKQGDKKIESEYKAETVYFSEGYDVKTLSIKNELPDLTIEINNKDAYVSKPSAGYDIVDPTYNVGSTELKTNSVLPDLSDILANPDKYKEPEKEEVVVDAEALLKSITEVQFKPFYDGTKDFEVLNDFETTPSVEEIQNEFSQFESFEIGQEESYENPESNEQDNYNDFEALYDNNYYDLDMPEDDEILDEIAIAEPPNAISLDTPTIQPPTRIIDEIAEPQYEKPKNLANDLLKKIQRTKQERENRKSRILEKKINKIEKNNNLEQKEQIKCIIENEALTIVSTVNFAKNLGCHLAKGANGYVILGFIGDKFFKIKNYEMLKSEKLQTRMSEKLDNGSSRYIVRIGLHKFIVNVHDDNIEYVMDLC